MQILGDEGAPATEVAWLRSKIGKGVLVIGRTAFVEAIMMQTLDRKVKAILET